MAAQELFFHFEKGKIFSQKTKSYTLTWVNELVTVIPCVKLPCPPARQLPTWCLLKAQETPA